MLKRVAIIICLVVIPLLIQQKTSLVKPALAQAIQEKTVTVHLFWGEGCPHCAKEKLFLESVRQKLPFVQIQEYEVWYNSKNRDLLKKVGDELGLTISGVPFTVIGSNYTVGYASDETSGIELLGYINSCVTQGCTDVVTEVISRPPLIPTPQPTVSPTPKPAEPKTEPKILDIPLFGPTDISNMSLPLLAIVIGTLDGFNPCAMWALLFLISLLVNLKDKRRMWLLGGAFIVASALVYFIFMSAWLNILLFIGFIVWVRVAIAAFAVAAGVFNLNKYRLYQTGCIVEESESRKKTFAKLKSFTTNKNFVVALAGIIGLAFAVNMLELMCSAGFPAIFTQILALNNLPTVAYYLYILIYIFFFMLDDMIVFFIAMKTLEVTGISTKYVKYSHLLGGLLMVIIGLLLILKPQYLMFSF
ncbi:TPA: hypothetical protein DCY43_04255 [candidate division WWE3 bacterium]|uniref:Thioredoxin domain-containing protein n=3 Tax=Katanobacteria TaxID=422282 RepID=A0A0G1KMD8_UNCKA|nr:MAG: hypothetical protein UW82_C0008G0013 [candidate division WWE3 bacterium GW2011_GWC2_44_9]HAZ29917.1 hypothetical protein [candidate division WWE3 bacterium]